MAPANSRRCSVQSWRREVCARPVLFEDQDSTLAPSQRCRRSQATYPRSDHDRVPHGLSPLTDASASRARTTSHEISSLGGHCVEPEASSGGSLTLSIVDLDAQFFAAHPRRPSHATKHRTA